MDDFYVVRCIGVIGAHGSVPPVGRWLAGFDPNLIDSTGQMQGLSTWTTLRGQALQFRTRDDAQDVIDLTPEDAPRRPDGTANRPLARYRLAIEHVTPSIEHVTPEAPKPRMSLMDEMRLDGVL